MLDNSYFSGGLSPPATIAFTYSGCSAPCTSLPWLSDLRAAHQWGIDVGYNMLGLLLIAGTLSFFFRKV